MSIVDTLTGLEPRSEQGRNDDKLELLSSAVAKLSSEEADALSELIADTKARATSDQTVVDHAVKDAQDKGRREALGMTDEEKNDLNLAVQYLRSITPDQLLNSPVFSWSEIQVLAQLQQKKQQQFT